MKPTYSVIHSLGRRESIVVGPNDEEVCMCSTGDYQRNAERIALLLQEYQETLAAKTIAPF